MSMRRRAVMSARSTAVVVLALPALVADSPRTPLAARPQGPSPVARVRILPAPELRLTGQVDSNSPAIWDLVEGEPRLHVFTSSAGIDPARQFLYLFYSEYFAGARRRAFRAMILF
jgi:hypothetical protein